MAAATVGDTSMLTLLLDHGALIQQEDSEHSTALVCACSRGHLDAVKLLVARGASIAQVFSPAENSFFAPMTAAAYGGHLPVLQFLKAQGASVTCAVGSRHSTALHAALDGGVPLDCIRWLIRSGNAVDATDTEGYTPLHVAARERYDAAVSLLVAAGAQVDARDHDGNTPLHKAAVVGAVECMKLLLAAGADPHSLTQREQSVLHAAIMGDSPGAVTLLLADPDFLCAHLGAETRHPAFGRLGTHHGECLGALLQSRAWQAVAADTREGVEGIWFSSAQTVATVERVVQHATCTLQQLLLARDSATGNRTLHIAVKCSASVQVICKLLKVGADPLAKDSAGQTPADLARASGKTLLAQLLDRAAQDIQGQA